MTTPDRKLFLHIGHGKTGSSYLQSSLALSVEALTEAGIAYPTLEKQDRFARVGHTSQGNFPPSGPKSTHLPTDIQKVLGDFDLSAHCNILLSSESLARSLCEPSVCQSIRDWFGPGQVRALFFVRDPLDYAMSAYQQVLKRGRPLEIAEFLQSFVAPSDTPVALDVMQDFGFDVTIYNYSRRTGRILELLAQWLGLDRSKLQTPPPGRVNRSMSRAEMELQQAFNRHIGRRSRLMVADPLVNRLPILETGAQNMEVRRDVLEEFLARMRIMVDEINPRLPASEFLFVPEITDAEVQQYLSPTPERFSFSAEQLDILAQSVARWLKPEYDPNRRRSSKAQKTLK